MYIRYLKNYKTTLGRTIPKGYEGHVTNDHARQLIKDGFAEKVQDPEDYTPYPENEDDERSVEKNESGKSSAKPRSGRSKTAKTKSK